MRLTPAVRALGAAIAVGAYALPPATGVLADLSHGAYHAYEGLAERQARAAAFGLVHLHDAPAARAAHTHADPAAERAPTSARAPVHEHGGAPHAHAEGVDLLLAASEDIGEEREHVAPTLVEFASHVPARPATLELRETRSRVPRGDLSPSPLDRSLRPPLPPPRA
ncbi:MAG: hypothetical protein WEB90_06790 [Gemmatimonadota bacterium]